MTATNPVYQRVHDVLVDLGVEPEDIHPEANLRSELEVDSAELVEIVAQVAPTSVDGKALKSVKSVDDLTRFLDGLG